MEIRVLRYFLAVAREGSMTRAADVLHVTQPTLSRQLKELEQALGKKLFTRSSHISFSQMKECSCEREQKKSLRWSIN